MGAPAEEWIGYRDVTEVDGKAVRDRAVRVQKLFMSPRPDDKRQLQRIAEESARHNLGTGRNINLPTFPLQTLRESARDRFVWTRQPDDPQRSLCCAVLAFAEVRSPTIVRTPAGRDVPIAGQVWVEPLTGRVTRAVLRFSNESEQVDGAFDVTYGARIGFDVLLPERLWEWYRTPDPAHLGRAAYVEGEASYGNFRQFTVSTAVSLGGPAIRDVEGARESAASSPFRSRGMGNSKWSAPTAGGRAQGFCVKLAVLPLSARLAQR
jgi:hypothetical protein